MSNPPVIVTVDSHPDLLTLHHFNSSRYPFLLQTVASSAGDTHFDILFACPQQSLILDGQLRLSINDGYGVTTASENNDFLCVFDQLWKKESGCYDSGQPVPFQGGWFLFLGYELAQQIEPSLQLPTLSQPDAPIACATRIPAAVVVNKSSGDCYIVVEGEFSQCINLIKNDIFDSKNFSTGFIKDHDKNKTIITSIIEEPPQKYLDAVTRVKQYIVDGDVFQVNLSRLWSAVLSEEINNTQLYKRLLQANPAPFFGLAMYDQYAILSSSPERLVRVKDTLVETRPIAGTRPRGNTKETDVANLQELLVHPKERAEHIMLIDLERNDLGRVCVPGSVQVNELMTLESYAHVHHIVSNVQGQLETGVTPGKVIRAVFPGGTITGCPKVRCMEIIAELEKQARGAYTGSLGYVNHDGSMDLNILIRTLVRNKGQLFFRAGAGIVADSIPEKELQETRAKAKGMLLAL